MAWWMLVPAAPLAAALVASLVRKARGAPPSVELRDRLGVPPPLWAGIGVLEGCAALGLAVGPARPVVGGAAAAGVVLLMLGAIVAHLRVGLSGRRLLPPATLLVVAAVAGLGFGIAA
jgi:hypothetical protein